MKCKYELSNLEKLVLDVLLDSDKGLTYEDIISLLPSEKEWNDKSVYSAMKQLKERGLIKAVGKIKVARTRAILYSPTLTKEEFYEVAFSEYFKKMQHDSIDCVLTAISRNRAERSEDITNEVEAWLQEYRNSIS